MPADEEKGPSVSKEHEAKHVRHWSRNRWSFRLSGFKEKGPSG